MRQISLLIFFSILEFSLAQPLQFSYNPLKTQEEFLLTSRQEIKLQGLLKKESTTLGWNQKNINNLQWHGKVLQTEKEQISKLQLQCLYHQSENTHSLGQIEPEASAEGNNYLLSRSTQGELLVSKTKPPLSKTASESISTIRQQLGQKNELISFLLSRSWILGETTTVPTNVVLTFMEINPAEAITKASLHCLQEEFFEGQRAVRFRVYVEAKQQKGDSSLEANFEGEIVVALKTTQLLLSQIHGYLKIQEATGSTQGEMFSSKKIEFFRSQESSTNTITSPVIAKTVAFSVSEYDPEDSFGTAGFLDKYGGIFCKIWISHPEYPFYAYQGIKGHLSFQDNLQKNLFVEGAKKLYEWKQKHPNTFGNFLELQEGLQTEEIRFFPNGSCLLSFYSRALPSDTANTLHLKGTFLFATGDKAGKITKVAPFLRNGTSFIVGGAFVKLVTNSYTLKKEETTGEEQEVPEYKLVTPLWISNVFLYDATHQLLAASTRSTSEGTLLIEIPPYLPVATIEIEYKDAKILEVPLDIYFGLGLKTSR